MNLLQTPRVVTRDLLHLAGKKSFHLATEPMLPKVECEYIKSKYLNAKHIIEFGSGGSTIFAVKQNLRITSIETDLKFYKFILSQVKEIAAENRLNYSHSDIGIIGKYGLPLFHTLRNNLDKKGLNYVCKAYKLAKTTPTPVDFIFIDGRWRSSCALYALITLNDYSNTEIVVDDYEGRDGYDRVNKYFSVSKIGRMASLLPRKDIVKDDLLIDFYQSLKDSV